MSQVHLEVIMNLPDKPEEHFTYDFEQDLIQIGRDEHNDIQIPLSTMSRSHCRLIHQNGAWFIEDVGSTHGTKLNGTPLGQKDGQLIRSGDRIDLINFYILFKTESEKAPENPEEAARHIVRKALVEDRVEDLPFVRVMNGPEQGSEYRLHTNQNEVTIGRSPDCDFHINDRNISRHHAKILRNWDDIEIEDLASKNGIFINEKKLEGRWSLRDADEIMLGAVRLIFIDPNSKYLGRIEPERDAASVEADGAEIDALLDDGFLEDSIADAPMAADEPDSNDDADLEDLDDEYDDEAPPRGVQAQQQRLPQKKERRFGAVDILMMLLGLSVLAGIVGLVYFLFFGEA